jgi:hypothetical protein
MGFRDMKLFNQALHGKQGWRLMTKPETSCSQVLKGKYYPNSEFLTATRKKSTVGEQFCMGEIFCYEELSNALARVPQHMYGKIIGCLPIFL